MEFDRYKFYHSDNRVFAVSSYAGQTVRGVAKCGPKDEFDLEKGKALAAKRCDLKIAEKRLKRAFSEYDKAILAMKKAQAYVEKMSEYERDAVTRYNEASLAYSEKLSEM